MTLDSFHHIYRYRKKFRTAVVAMYVWARALEHVSV